LIIDASSFEVNSFFSIALPKSLNLHYCKIFYPNIDGSRNKKVVEGKGRRKKKKHQVEKGKRKIEREEK